MATIQEIKAVARKVEKNFHRFGRSWLLPPVALRCGERIRLSGLTGLKEGEIVYADEIGEEGRLCGTVHLEEKGYWWPLELFEVCLFEEWGCWRD